MTKHNKRVPRRTFLKTAGAAAAAGAAIGVPQLIPSKVLAAPGRKGANERINVGHIGWGGRSRGLYGELGGLRDDGECQSIAVCDVDERRLEQGAKAIAGAAVYRDYRYILQRKDIDAVVIGTPDHWHGVQFVHSAEAGKHIYCEKPACCTIEESKAMVAAAKKAGIASQIGSQGRSQPEAYLMHRYLANGVIGKVHHVECFHDPSPEDHSRTPDGDPPPELDWDLWLGPLRWRPYNARYHHGVFRWLLESGGGQIRDRGAHVMSCAKYWMGADGQGPVTVDATGTPPNEGLWDSAVLMKVTYTFKNPDWMMTWTQMPREEIKARFPAEERSEEDFKQPGVTRISRWQYGAVYHGSDGRCMHWGGDGGTWAERKVRLWVPPAGAKDVYKSPGHMEDWFVGIRTGKKCIMDIEYGAGVANLCVLGNLSFILGRKIQWDEKKWAIAGDEEARRMMSRPQRHPYHL
jgi:predicted dehydrogenase